MTTSIRTTGTLAVGAVTGALLLGGCTGGSTGDESADGDRGIDASQYVEQYSEQAQDQAASGSQSSVAGPGASNPGPPGLLDDNTFVDHGTSGFISALEDPQSTFALDVDSGSYTVARTLLDQGIRPPAESIRVEEWVNSFGYGDSAPSDTDLAVTAETGTAPSLDDGTQLVRVAVSSRDVDSDERPPVHVTLVVDRSGSMDIRERLGLVKSSLGVLANRLRDDDTVAVVSFDDQAAPILEPTAAKDSDAILGAIDELQPGGSTNLEAGLRLGYEQARESYDEDAVNVVVLCSDGVANVGQTGPGSITDRIAEEGADGIHLVTVGFGMGNYNDHLMEQLADLGDGFYSYVDTYEETERLFGTDLTTTLVPVAGEAAPRWRSTRQGGVVPARGLREPGPRRRGLRGPHGGRRRARPGPPSTALYEVRLREGVEPGEPIGTADVRWTSVADGSAQEAEVEVTSAPAADADAAPGIDFELATTVADTAQLLKGAEGFAERDLSLADLELRAEDLVDSDVDGAEELLELIRAAEEASG